MLHLLSRQVMFLVSLFCLFQAYGDDSFKTDPLSYCSKVETPEQVDGFKSNRQITEAPTTETTGYKFLQSQVIVRHGARTLHGPWPCFPGYKPQWDCASGEKSTSWKGFETAEEASFPFIQTYDAKVHLNPLGGTCLSGQLISEGVEQHKILGEVIGNAYFKNNRLFDLGSVVTGPLDDYIYFRSTDMQRTRMSGATLLTSIIKTVNPSVQPRIKLHLAEYKKDNLFPNSYSCYTITEAQKMALSGTQYESRFAVKNAEASRLALELMGISNDTSLQAWPFLPFDCLYSLICANQNIPTEGEGWSRKNIETILKATQEVVEWQYRANDGLYAKRGLKAFVYELKAFAIHALCKENAECVDNLFDDKKESADHYKYITSPTEPIKSTPFALWSAHDTTILAYLASFGDAFWDKVATPDSVGNFASPFPAYASALIIEVYESNAKLDHKFRMIYNGKVITSAVPNCEANKELCSLKTLFAAQNWSTLDSIDEKCPSKKPQPSSDSSSLKALALISFLFTIINI